MPLPLLVQKWGLAVSGTKAQQWQRIRDEVEVPEDCDRALCPISAAARHRIAAINQSRVSKSKAAELYHVPQARAIRITAPTAFFPPLCCRFLVWAGAPLGPHFSTDSASTRPGAPQAEVEALPRQYTFSAQMGGYYTYSVKQIKALARAR